MSSGTGEPRVLTSFAGEEFEVLSCIGRGATGGVYRARTAASRVGFVREVCIKRLTAQLSPEAERAMREEARLLASVRHANVVSILAMGQEPSGAPFLVLELVDGADLSALRKAVVRRSDPETGPAGVLPDKIAAYVGCAVLRALGAVQRATPGLVHRDVTPQNVLISREGEVKLTDFGIALALDRARWTIPSVVKGKFGYMAPEQIRGEPLDVRTDLFALGVVLFELLAGRRPWFAPQGTLDELRAIERGEIASILECRSGIDHALAMVVDRLLALDMRDRFPNADAALRALAPFAAGEVGSLRLAAIVHDVLPRPQEQPDPKRTLRRTQSAPKLDLPRDPSARDMEGEVSRIAPAPRRDLVAYGPSLGEVDPAAIERTIDEAAHQGSAIDEAARQGSAIDGAARQGWPGDEAAR